MKPLTVARHPGIYYRPRPGGKVGPPYEIRYLDSSGKRRWAIVHGNLDEAEAKRAELLLRRRRGERIEPTRQTFAEYAREWLDRQEVRPRTRENYTWALEQHLIPRFGHPPEQAARPDYYFRAASRQIGRPESGCSLCQPWGVSPRIRGFCRETIGVVFGAN